MTLRHLEIFMSVYQNQSITKASKELHISQPSVSLAIKELEELLTEEKIQENINKRDFSNRKDYYVELYNTIMSSNAMKKQYNSLEEKIKDEKSKLIDKVNQIDKISEFLKKNSDSWEIKDDKIQFTNLNRMTEYYSLLNKLID